MTNAPSDPWTLAATLDVKRVNPVFGDLEPVDRGANFFVLALEALGAKTRFSCEGHPNGFYVSFEAPYELAMRIQSAGLFSVEIEGNDHWSLRKTMNERPGPEDSETMKIRMLRHAAMAWVSDFGVELMKSPELAAVLDLDEAPAPRRSLRPR